MEDENKYQLVTLEEMRELAKSENYSLDDAELKFEKWGCSNLKNNIHIKWWKPNLLRDHLLLEECMSRDDIDWGTTTHSYDFRMIAYMRYLWYNPLVWVPIPEEEKNERIIDGRVAEERFVNRDEPESWTPVSYNFCDEMLDWFARNMPKFDGQEVIDVFEGDFVTHDICLWNYLTTDDTALRLSIMHGGDFNLSLLQIFSPQIFVQNMMNIAVFCGGAKAADIIQLFRKDWTRIVTLKLFDIGKLSKEEIEDFRTCLFEGMDYYLERWNEEASACKEPEKITQKTPSCRYIDKDKLVETGIHTLEEFTDKLRKACEQDAKYLGDFLTKYYKLGYLDFHGDGKKKIYEHLKECFPGAIKYSYPNFTQYFH